MGPDELADAEDTFEDDGRDLRGNLEGVSVRVPREAAYDVGEG